MHGTTPIARARPFFREPQPSFLRILMLTGKLFLGFYAVRIKIGPSVIFVNGFCLTHYRIKKITLRPILWIL